MIPDNCLLCVLVQDYLPSPWLQPVALAFAGAVFGSLSTFGFTLALDWLRRKVETRHLALAISAEVRALEKIMEEMKEQTPPSLEFALESARYVDVDPNAVPITKAAAGKAGQFPRPVSEALAEFLTRLANFAQQQSVVRNMQSAAVLTDAKLLERLQLTLPFANRLIESGIRLQTEVGRYYGRN